MSQNPADVQPAAAHIGKKRDSEYRPLFGLAVLALAQTALSGCGTLPRASPNVHEILKSKADAPQIPFVLAEVTAQASPLMSYAQTACSLDAPAQALSLVHPGDRLRIQMFEIGVSLFARGTQGALDGDRAEGAANARGTVIEAEVDREGNIRFPFLGPIPVAGKLPEAVADDIKARLAKRSQAPDVLVSNLSRLHDHVTITGDARNLGQLPLRLEGDHLLDVLAQARGVEGRADEAKIRISRGDTSCDLRFDQIVLHPDLNVQLAPGDHIHLARQPRSFTVLGSARAVDLVQMPKENLSLAEAIGLAGGPLDSEADPTGVFLFRWEKGEDGKDKPLIYRLNLLDPESYFTSQRFFVRDGDIQFIASARSNQFTKFIQLLNLLVTPAVSGRILAR